METIWEQSLDFLKTEVNDQTFAAWFLPIKQLSLEEDVLTLSVPNKFFEDWIRDKYLPLLQASLLKASGKEISIQFKIVALPAQETPTPETISGLSLDQSREPKTENRSWLKNLIGGPKQMPESQYQQIGLNPRYTFDNFVVGANNRFAHAASLAVSESPAKNYNPLFIHGGVGLGKTHLLQAIGHHHLKSNPKAKLLYISGEEFTNQLIRAIRTRTTPNFRNMYRNVDILLIDDIQFIAGKESTQEEFFHTFNKLYDSHKQIVMASDRSPREIPTLEERLVSRFAWGLIADVQLPDFETRIAIISKKCELEDTPISQDVLYFLAEKIRTNIREMEGALIRVVAYAELTGSPLSVELAREVLKGMISAEEKKITMPLIQEIVSEYFGISVTEMNSRRRTNAIAYPRQIAMFLSRSLTDHSLPDIGTAFGGRDHTTVLHANEKIKKELIENENTKSVISLLESKIRK
jgi:chromosomal replication initiator protein